jgi:hypothetical protein
MQKFLLLLFLIPCCILSAQDISLTKTDSLTQHIKQSFLSISPLISPKICIGINIAKQNKNNHWVEYDYYIHAFLSKGLKTYGVAGTYNYFWSGTRKGYFTQLIAGIDRVYFNGFDSNSDIVDGIALNLAAGFGYSYQVKDNSFLRIFLDVGYKWFISNLHISYVW